MAVKSTVDAVVTLQEAAELLGVHYMTAYRYVRLGLLPAEKVGPVWQVAVADVDVMRAGPARRGGKTNRAPWSERLRSRLLAGDEQGAWGVVEAALTAGSDPTSIHLDVLTPAMREVGDLWERGEIDVADEHRATVVATRLVGRLSPRFNRRGRSRGCVVVGCAPGERHALSTLVLADVLRGGGWSVLDLGGDVPLESFVKAVQGEGSLAAIGISVSWDGAVDAAAATVSRLRDVVDVPILAGGRAATEQLGADAVPVDAAGTLAVLEGARD